MGDSFNYYTQYPDEVACVGLSISHAVFLFGAKVSMDWRRVQNELNGRCLKVDRSLSSMNTSRCAQRPGRRHFL